MRKEKIEVIRYECGDILDISKVEAETSSTNGNKAPGFNKAKIAIVLSETNNKDGTKNYTILCDNLKVYTLKSGERGREKYIDHIDLNKYLNIEISEGNDGES